MRLWVAALITAVLASCVDANDFFIPDGVSPC